MTIRLLPPEYRPGGPDGQGWNRLSLNAHIGTGQPQCALRPRSYPTLVDSQDTRRARWGGYGACIRPQGDCEACPVLTREPRELRSFMPTVLVRLMVHTTGRLVAQSWQEPWVMNRPDRGWGEYGEPWTWADLSRLPGWRIGRSYRDDDSEGFLLHATRRHGPPYAYGFGDEPVPFTKTLEEAFA